MLCRNIVRKMAHPFLCLVRSRCFSLSAFPTPLHENLRRSPTPIPFPRPKPTLTLPHSSSSRLDLISTTELWDGSLVFCFGDDDTQKTVTTHTERHDFPGSSRADKEDVVVIDAEADAISVTGPDNESVAAGAEPGHTTTTTADATQVSLVLLAEDTPSTASEDEIKEGKVVRRDVSEVSTPIKAELHTVEGTSDGEEISTAVHPPSSSAALLLHPSKLTKKAPSATSEDEFTEGKAHKRDVSGVSIPTIAELHAIEGTSDREDISAVVHPPSSSAALLSHPSKLAENTPSATSEDELTKGKEHERDVSGVSTPTIVESHANEGTANGEDILSAVLQLSSSATLLPHPSKALTGGDNAYFISCKNWLGVADGVGHWSLEGINPGLHAHELMENCERFLSDCKGIPLTEPEKVLICGAAKTRSPGLSAVLVAYFDGQALHVANIGNSGFMVIRNGAIFKRSSAMVHEFNFPLQIQRGDDPSELIERYQIDLEEGDVIVTATDGLFDNLYGEEITSIVSNSMQSRLKLKEIAEFLATRAQEVGRSTSRRSPFADAAKASGYAGYNGGKLDDVIVILSHVEKKPMSTLQ